MRTARSSGRLRGACFGGVSPRHSPGQTPREQAPPPPQLGAGTPPGPGTPWNQAPPRGQTHTCKHITLPQTSFAGGNNIFSLPIFTREFACWNVW